MIKLYKVDEDSGEVKCCNADRGQVDQMEKAGWSSKEPEPEAKNDFGDAE